MSRPKLVVVAFDLDRIAEAPEIGRDQAAEALRDGANTPPPDGVRNVSVGVKAHTRNRAAR
jgi:hypothetical protein